MSFPEGMSIYIVTICADSEQSWRKCHWKCWWGWSRSMQRSNDPF